MSIHREVDFGPDSRLALDTLKTGFRVLACELPQHVMGGDPYKRVMVFRYALLAIAFRRQCFVKVLK
jgi:hypothetical protein